MFIFLRISVSTFCNAGLVVINSFSLCFLWKFLVSPLILKDNFSGYSNLDWQLVFFRTWNSTSHAFLVFRIMLRSLLLFWLLYFYKWLVLLSCSFQYPFFVLNSWHLNHNMMWRSSFLIMSVWDSKHLLFQNVHIFPTTWEYSAIISLNKFLCFQFVSWCPQLCWKFVSLLF
jgi:hypothetical protein